MFPWYVLIHSSSCFVLLLHIHQKDCAQNAFCDLTDMLSKESVDLFLELTETFEHYGDSRVGGGGGGGCLSAFSRVQT